MNLMVSPLPVDTLDGAYNYLIMVDLMFGRDKAN